MIVVVFGLPGSGKSFFAARLAKRLGAAYVSSDVVRFRILPVRRYTVKEKSKVYEAMLSEMEQALVNSGTVVVDGTFYQEQFRAMFVARAAALQQAILFIEVRADEDLIRERLSHKRPDSEADYGVYLDVKHSFEPFAQDHLVLRSTQDNIDIMLQKGLDYIHHEQPSGTSTSQGRIVPG